MEVTVCTEGSTILATVSGRFDVHGVARYTASVIENITASTPHVIVDLGSVEFMDSSALAALVRTLKRTVELGGSVALARPSHAARIILELTRLDEVFESSETVSQAWAALSARVAS